MALIAKAPRGTQDVLPGDCRKWQFLEEIIREEAALHGHLEMRTPVFESTDLFQRSVGDTTDVVQKEMYTFEDRGGRSVTLRPEGTAGMARAMLEHGLYNEGLPLKIYYFTSCYRYEKPQTGRLREFHQFGMETFGAADPAADADMISMMYSLLTRLGVRDFSLEINSIGCPSCRAEYHKALKEYFEGYRSDLCETCLSRLERNPMRILDCKSPVCSKIAAGAPTVLDYICEDCAAHFEGVKAYLNAVNIPFRINPHIVRGLDYYTRTVFEFISEGIGTQGTICGGGRYDGLIKELGGPDMPSLGFGMGMERLLLLLENQGIEFPEDNGCDLFIASLGDPAKREAFRLVREARSASLAAECDIAGRSLKAQMKFADKIKARFCLVLGDDELAAGKAELKNMKTGEKSEITLGEGFIPRLADIAVSAAQEELSSAAEALLSETL